MKVSFIQPYYHNFWEPLWSGYLIQACKLLIKNIDILFFHEAFDKSEDIIKESSKADFVCLSATSPTYSRALYFVEEIKKINPNVKTILGGWHVTASYRTGFLEIPKFVDYIIAGEGDVTLPVVLSLKNLSLRIFEGFLIPYVRYWPDRKAMKIERQFDYCEKNFGERIASVQSIRGCKSHCKMCAEFCMTQGNVRIRNPNDVMDEIEYLQKEYNINRIKFVDPTWAVSDNVVLNFCNEKIKRRNNIKWDCMVHAAYATEKSLEMMTKADCDMIMVGVESGSQKILNSINKGVTVNKIKKVFEWGRKYGLSRRAFFLLGTPEEDNDSIMKTMELAKDIDPDVIGFTILAPYPGTEFYDYKRFKDVDWSKVDEYANDIWSTPNFTNQQLKEIQKWFVEMFKDKIPWHQKILLGQKSAT